MISKSVCVSTKDAVKYFEDHLDGADYFVSKEKSHKGQFFGKIAQRLGLQDKQIGREDFIAFAQCDMMALGAASSRQRISDIKYIEFTYSPPKAVSIAASIDDRIKGELYAAVKEELRWFETLADVRDRRGHLFNREVTRPTGEILVALFEHETSRTNDPDFHVHALVGNVTWDEQRKAYFALHYGQMLEMRKTLDARIHNNLAARMGKLGYHLEAAPHGFGLSEVPVEALTLFSERGRQVQAAKTLLQQGYSSGQITAALKGMSEKERGECLSSAARFKERLGKPEGKPVLRSGHHLDQIAVTLTRPKKVRISAETLRDEVARRLEQAGLTVAKASPEPVEIQVNLEKAIQQGTDIAFDKESVVRLDHLFGEIVRLAPGQISNDEWMTHLRDDGRFLVRRMDSHEFVTTRQVLGEEKTLLTCVVRGLGAHAALQSNYETPDLLRATPQRIDELVSQARARGEELTREQAKNWLGQFAAIHKYVCTSEDQFLNIRGGAGTGKTFCLEQLVAESRQAGRPVFICAPYGEQSRVLLRGEASRLKASGRRDVTRVFAEANTVDSLLITIRRDPSPYRGADIYVDEAGLLDTRKALALVREAERVKARVIFQGDTEQLPAVGRGQPIKLMQEELKLGMHVPRASISRRQLSQADKQLAADLSSGNEAKFLAAVRKMIDRRMIRQTPPGDAVEQVAREIVGARANGKEIVAVSSVHRIGETLSERIHALHTGKHGQKGQALLDVHVQRELQPAEIRSPNFYAVGDVVQFKRDGVLVRAPVVSVTSEALVVERSGETRRIAYDQIHAVFEASRIERGPGEKLLLQERIKQEGKVFERGSRQTISSVEGATVTFASGLKLPVNDGRVRQGDCLTDYKAQGLKGLEVRGIEDNASAMSLGSKEAFHIKGTRHIQGLVLHVEDKELYVEAIQRSGVKLSAMNLERREKTQGEQGAEIVPAPQKQNLVQRVRDWGKDFVSRLGKRERAEKTCVQRINFEMLHQRLRELVMEQSFR